MVYSTAPTTAAPLSRKRTERVSPSPEDDLPSDSKKSRLLDSSRSFSEDLKDMPANNVALAGPHTHVIGTVDCKQALVFQFVDVQEHDPNSALLFGVVVKSGMRVLVIVQNLGGSVPDFLRRHQVNAMCLAELPGGKYSELNEHERLSHNQTEFIIDREDLVIQPAQEQWQIADPVPLRILSFDIETNVPLDETFPVPRNDPAIQIGNIVQENGDTYRVIFTLRGCSPIAGAEVRSFETESAMLSAWRQFVLECDPDVVTGHNIARFDFMYLITRADVLEIHDFACLGRLKGRTTTVFENQPFLPWENGPVLHGRLQLDVLQYYQEKTERLAGHKLADLAQRELNGAAKEIDFHFTMIRGLQDGSDDDRKRLAVYCLKDAHLPLRLLNEKACLEEAVTAARSDDRKYLAFSDFLRIGRNFKP
ncbi:DNA polymerase [Favolaschia claudopus]|uniref:DNA polymerase delta catalytic subunit n=1 Tax=Favolaschia claudopus TaxID=2862362 RepID=A0AAW0DAW0_9AGAR